MSSPIPYQWSREHLNFILLEDKSRIIDDPIQINAFRTVNRGDFVPAKYKEFAYADTDIEIGYGQKLDKPSLIATQIKLLSPKVGSKILEIGTGSGYMSAILGYIVGPTGEVVALERILSLVESTRRNLSKYPDLINSIEIIFKDGYKGYSEEAPYDSIVASAFYDELPEILKTQLKVGGKLVAPTSNYDIVIATKTTPIQLKEEIVNGYIFDKMLEGVE